MEMKYDCSAITARGPCVLALRYCLYTYAGPFKTSGRGDSSGSVADGNFEHCTSQATKLSRQQPLVSTSHQISSVREVNNRRLLIY